MTVYTAAMHTGAALIASLLVMATSLVGVVFTAGNLGRWMQKYLTYLTTFSAGVFLLVAYHLAEEAVHEGGWLAGVSSVIIGALIMESIHFLLPTKHHHHGVGHDHAHTPIDGRSMLLSDALHNIGDGILLVGAFATNLYVGIAATVGVILHETVQEISEYFVLREAGYSNSGALIRNLAVSSSILIGLFLATYLSAMDSVLAILSGIAAGGFLSVILHDLLPHAIASIRTHGNLAIHVSAFVIGALGMLGLQIAMPHEEETEAPLATESGNTIIISDTAFEPTPTPAQTPSVPVVSKPTPIVPTPNAVATPTTGSTNTTVQNSAGVPSSTDVEESTTATEAAAGTSDSTTEPGSASGAPGGR